MKFYGHFAAAYGTLWLILFGAALLTQSRINLGTFGMIGFPVISLLYAIIRYAFRRANESTKEHALEQRIRQLESRQSVPTEPGT